MHILSIYLKIINSVLVYIVLHREEVAIYTVANVTLKNIPEMYYIITVFKLNFSSTII